MHLNDGVNKGRFLQLQMLYLKLKIHTAKLSILTGELGFGTLQGNTTSLAKVLQFACQKFP